MVVLMRECGNLISSIQYVLNLYSCKELFRARDDHNGGRW